MAEYTAAKTELFVDKAGSGTYTKVGQCKTIQHGGRSVSVVEFSDLDSTALRRRPGLPDPGTLSIDLNYDPEDTEHLFLEGLADTPQVLNFRISYSQTSPAQLRTFPGFLTNFESGGGENQDALEASLEIQIAGAIVKSVAEGED